MLFARTNLFRRQLPFGDENVQAGSAFQRGAVSGIEEAAAILEGVFAVALGNIQGDRSGCPVQLIFHVADPHRYLQDHRQPGNETDRFSIHFQFFMIEPGFRRLHGILLLIFIVLFIVFLILIFLLTLNLSPLLDSLGSTIRHDHSNQPFPWATISSVRPPLPSAHKAAVAGTSFLRSRAWFPSPSL